MWGVNGEILAGLRRKKLALESAFAQGFGGFQGGQRGQGEVVYLPAQAQAFSILYCQLRCAQNVSPDSNCIFEICRLRSLSKPIVGRTVFRKLV